MNWFFIDESITDGERRQGPYSIDDIRDFVKQGKITDNTLVWRSGEESWKPWNSYEESKENETAYLEASRDELIRTTIEQLLREQASTRHYAGFIIRVLAYIIDNCILGLFGGLLVFIMSLMGAVDLEIIQQAAENYISSPTSMDALDKLGKDEIKNEEKLDKDVGSYGFTLNGKYIYYIKDTEKDDSVLYGYRLGAKAPVKIDDDVYDWRVSLSGDTVVYFTDVSGSSGDLRIAKLGKERTRIAADVYRGTLTSGYYYNYIAPKGFWFFKDIADGYADLYYWNGKSAKKAAEAIDY